MEENFFQLLTSFLFIEKTMTKFLFCLFVVCAIISAAEPTIIPVTTNADPGPGSLREAIATANGAGDFIIRFQAGLSPIVLTSAQLQITKAAGTLRIEGPGADKLSISGQDTYRIFYITQGTISIAGLTLTHGNANDGGAIYATGSDVTLANCTIAENKATNIGGGICAKDYVTLSLDHCTISGNQASSSPDSSSGGGIYATDDVILSLNHCTISGNQAGYAGGGICAEEYNVTLSLNNCIISGNQVNTIGGGITAWYGTLTFNHCTISENHTKHLGGGIAAWDSTLTFNHCTISGNQAESGGGGIYAEKDTITSNNCTISENQAKSSSGGGIYAKTNGTISCSHCTISGNQAAAVGGGIYAENVIPAFNNCTISRNQARSGGGICYVIKDSTPFNIRNTIVGNNTASSNRGNDIWSKNTNSQGYNLIQDIKDSNMTMVKTDLIGFDPLLGPLASNGGPTQTMALNPSSPAVNAGNTDLPTDQRGSPRNDGSPDIGAYEYQADPFNCGATGLEFGVFLLALALLRKW